MAIVLDAMGGDHAPEEVVQGAKAAAQNGLKIYLTGPENTLGDLVGDASGIEIIDAPEIVSMSESPSEVLRKKPRSSIVVGVKLAKEKGIPFVSAGNTGACMASALFGFGRLPGIKRPPIASLFPQITGGSTTILDVGANVDCSSQNLLHFAIMGCAYSKAVCGVENPSVGLLSNGEEDEKGNALVLETHQLLKESGLNFIGNVEGFDVLSGKCDVIVCDGFVGNILLKTTEGVATALLKLARSALPESGDLSPDLMQVLGKLNKYNPKSQEHTGAPLLGIQGICYIVHGSANAKTIEGACLNAHKVGQSGLIELIASELQERKGK